MPYITSSSRERIDNEIPPLVEAIRYLGGGSGNLNYAITQLLLTYLDKYLPVSYADYNSVIGVLESAKLEFYRRLVAQYEDIKIEENGDVFPTITPNKLFEWPEEHGGEG